MSKPVMPGMRTSVTTHAALPRSRDRRKLVASSNVAVDQPISRLSRWIVDRDVLHAGNRRRRSRHFHCRSGEERLPRLHAQGLLHPGVSHLDLGIRARARHPYFKSIGNAHQVGHGPGRYLADDVPARGT